nr:UvrD-helicase domain-containing protein [Buchnera aphidicola]
MQYIKYDEFKFPSPDITLIEASAGTGKTFSIIILYLRLLINSGLKKKYKRSISSKNILIVTFTEASKNELQKRLYLGITQLYSACINKKTKVDYIKNIFHDIQDYILVQKILKKLKIIQIIYLYSHFMVFLVYIK